jgi:hypothetical protein
MKQIHSFLLLMTAIFISYGMQCNDCQKVDCDPGFLVTRFVSKADGSNLFDNGAYQRDSLTVYRFLPDMSLDDYSANLFGWRNSNQSDVYFVMDREAPGYVYQFNSQERDTLTLNFSLAGGSDCCEDVPLIAYGVFRGDTIFPNDAGFLTLSK